MSRSLSFHLQRALRLGPIYLAIRLAKIFAAITPRRSLWRAARRPRPFAPGISVLIPERGTPDLLAETLAAATVALARVDEPRQLIVVVNGAPAHHYDALRAAHPDVQWQFHAAPLGYNGAIAAGLGVVRHDWVYLLNSDMRLEPDALIELLGHREAHVFALTSQIFFADTERRREETGWSDFNSVGADVEMFERMPEASDMARGNLYPGGGSSLIRSEPLRRYVRGSDCYSPFYFEDAEWGVRAWADGWEMLFVPRSRAHHHHRGTVRRYYDADEVERIFTRNRLLFELFYHWTDRDARHSIGHLSTFPLATQREIGTLRNAWRLLVRRTHADRLRALGFNYRGIAAKYYPHAVDRQRTKPRVLLVTPFAVFPPAHGGARRIAELTRRLADHVELILLSDEQSLYGPDSEPGLEAFCSVHLTEGRGDKKGEGVLAWPERLQRHAHPRLRAELERLIAVYDPDIVQLEFMELAQLARSRQGRARWLLALHDVYLDGGQYDALQRECFGHFDAVSVCSDEDAQLLGQAKAHLIPNGAVNRLQGYVASPATPNILFMGPFRYAPNREGIGRFLSDCWPLIRAASPTATLTILGGVESSELVIGDARFAQPGVELIDRFVDPAPYLHRATLTINPQQEIRGSALKLIESLLAGRVCVSTQTGARGFSASALSGLIVVADIASMVATILPLLHDHARRHALERADDAAVAAFTWEGIAAKQLALYRDVMGVATP